MATASGRLGVVRPLRATGVCPRAAGGRFTLCYVVGGLVVMALLYWVAGLWGKLIGYSAFVELIRSGSISRVELDGNYIHGFSEGPDGKSGLHVRIRAVEDPELEAQLEERDRTSGRPDREPGSGGPAVWGLLVQALLFWRWASRTLMAASVKVVADR